MPAQKMSELPVGAVPMLVPSCWTLNVEGTFCFPGIRRPNRRV